MLPGFIRSWSCNFSEADFIILFLPYQMIECVKRGKTGIEIKKERNEFHPLVHIPDGCKHCNYPDFGQEPGAASRSLTWVARIHICVVFHYCPSTWQGPGWEVELALIWDAGTAGTTLPTRSQCCTPDYFIKNQEI